MSSSFIIPPSDAPMETLAPLFLDHYLWLDNGYRPEVQARLAYDSEALRVHFKTYEEKPLIRYTLPNDPVYKDSCAELFLQPVPHEDGRYLNFELNAAGTLLLGLGENRVRSYLQEAGSPLFSIEAAVGRVDPGDGRKFWELRFRIPFSWIISYFPSFTPTPGTLMRGNLYKCGDETPLPHYGCWSKVSAPAPDYHRSCDFGELRLG